MDIAKRRKVASDLSLGSSHDCIYKKAIELLEPFAGKELRLLDFGAGQGTFLQRIHGREYFGELSGIDLMSAPERLFEDIQWFSGDLNHQTSLPQGHFDIVTALEVVEHLENPRHMFREIYRVLKQGGRAVVSTPNNESYRSLISYLMRGHFVDFTDSSYPAHITPVNRKDLERASREVGFKLLGWDYTNQGALPGWTSWSWQKISLGTAKGLRFSDNLFLILEKP